MGSASAAVSMQTDLPLYGHAQVSSMCTCHMYMCVCVYLLDLDDRKGRCDCYVRQLVHAWAELEGAIAWQGRDSMEYDRKEGQGGKESVWWTSWLPATLPGLLGKVLLLFPVQSPCQGCRTWKSLP